MKRRSFIKGSLLLAAGTALATPVYGKQPPVQPAAKPDPSQWSSNGISIAWLGHSTVLINIYGKIVLTDPVLFDRVGLTFAGTNFGPTRYTAPALTVEELPKPDLLLLSHAHMDHMDYLTLSAIADRFPAQIDVLTAFNTMDVIQDLNWKSLREADWGDKLELNGISICALEVKHFGWRYPWERDRSRGYMDNGRSFNAYTLQRGGKTILFGGDTANTDAFSRQGVTADIAIMPVGAYQPWRVNHCNPEEALIMARQVGASVFIPIHCSTFKQGMEPLEEPLAWVRAAHANYKVMLGIQDIGETFTA